MNPVDIKEREIIVNELNKNIFVEAGAGSGKTRSLVERMVMMVRKGIDVSQICAITFTKAAATEFYNRFETMLSNTINSKDVNDEEKERCKKALLNIDLCFMGTIDSFCNMILSENPIEAGIPLNSSIVEEEEYKFLLADEYNNIINNISDQKQEEILDDFLRFQSNAKNAFTECVNKLLNKRNYEVDVKDLADIKKREKEFYDKYKGEIQRLVKKIIEDDGKHIDGSGKETGKAKEFFLTNSWRIFEDWNEYPTAILNFLNKGLKKIHLFKEIPTLTREFNSYFLLSKNKKFYTINDDKMKDVVGEFESIRADYTINFVNYCVNRVSKNLIDKGKLSFFDNLLLFRDLLKNDIKNGGGLIKHINRRHKYYFVDEFQDTDPLQSEIVFYLTATTPNEDFSKCKPAPGTLFIVGDPKQSIYRFRNADVVSYDYIKQLFKNNGDEFVELTTNFRSQKKLIEYFNAQFNILFSDDYNGLQAPFKSVDYFPDNKDKPIIQGVYKYRSNKDDDPEHVGNLIVNLVNNGYKYGDIMVLTNTRPRLKDYLEVFENKSIPYEIEGQSVFDRCEVFLNLRYLMGAVANPDNSYYVYKALKKILKMSDSTIYSIYNHNKPTLLEIKNNKKIDKLVNFINDNKNESIIVIFDRLIDEFDLMNTSNIKHLEYLYYSKELLRARIVDGSIVTIKEAHKFLMDLTDKDIVEKCLSLSKPNKNEDDKDNRVLLANVHKVKGLERKVVVLTSNYKNSSSDPEKKVEIHTSFKKKKNYVIKIAGSSDQDSFVKFNYLESKDYQNEQTDEGIALLCESDRIAYVAATRAIDALFISSNSLSDENKNKTPWGKLIASEELESFVRFDDTLFKEYPLPTPKEIQSSSLKTDVVDFDSSFLNKTYEIKSPSKLVNMTDSKEDIVSNTINDDATLKGTIVHRLLELYVSNKFNDSIETYLSIINNEFLLESKYDELLKNVYSTINNGGYKQDKGKVDDLLTELKESDEIITEVPFAYKDGNDIYNGIIDLLYKKDNKWYIVDYKTNLDDKELDKKYENQLEGYKKALLTQGIEAEAYIYHIDIK